MNIIKSNKEKYIIYEYVSKDEPKRIVGYITLMDDTWRFSSEPELWWSSGEVIEIKRFLEELNKNG